MERSVDFLKPNKNLKPSWFGIPILLNKKYVKQKKKISQKVKSKWNRN